MSLARNRKLVPRAMLSIVASRFRALTTTDVVARVKVDFYRGFVNRMADGTVLSGPGGLYMLAWYLEYGREPVWDHEHDGYADEGSRMLRFTTNISLKGSPVQDRDGENALAGTLGFGGEGKYDLLSWADQNPDLWGNESGEMMFRDARAYVDHQDFEPGDPYMLVQHWDRVLERVGDAWDAKDVA